MNNFMYKVRFDRARRVMGIALLMLLAVSLAAILSYHSAGADAGGNPTKTPTPSATVTLTPTETLYVLPPVITISDVPPEEAIPVVPTLPNKGVPTGTVLSESEILATLQATLQATPVPAPARSSTFWLYMLLLLGISGAVVLILWFGLWNRKKTNPPPNE